MILENLKTAGVQQGHKEDRISFTALTPWPGELVCAEGRYRERAVGGGGAVGVQPSGEGGNHLVDQSAELPLSGDGTRIALLSDPRVLPSGWEPSVPSWSRTPHPSSSLQEHFQPAAARELDSIFCGRRCWNSVHAGLASHNPL